MFSPKPRFKKKLALGFRTAEPTALARYLFQRTPEFKSGGCGEFFLIDPWKHDRDVVWSITQDLPNNVCQQQIIGRKTVVGGPTHVMYIAGTFLGVSHFGLRHGKEPTSNVVEEEYMCAITVEPGKERATQKSRNRLIKGTQVINFYIKFYRFIFWASPEPKGPSAQHLLFCTSRLRPQEKSYTPVYTWYGTSTVVPGTHTKI